MIFKYPIIGYQKVGKNKYIPIIGIPIMSDEEWQKECKRQAVKSYLKHFRKPPDNINVALDWQQQKIADMLADAEVV